MTITRQAVNHANQTTLQPDSKRIDFLRIRLHLKRIGLNGARMTTLPSPLATLHSLRSGRGDHICPLHLLQRGNGSTFAPLHSLH